MNTRVAFFIVLVFDQARSLTDPFLLVLLVVVFLVGFFVGRRTSNIKVSASVDLEPSPALGGTPRLSVQTKVIRKMEIKCKCGAIYKFAGGAGPLLSGCEPMPTGDSFICPKCGNQNDLTAARDLLRDAGL